MTEMQRTFLAHCVKMAQTDKAYAWFAAKKYAELYPDDLANLPELLTNEMKRQNDTTR